MRIYIDMSNIKEAQTNTKNNNSRIDSQKNIRPPARLWRRILALIIDIIIIATPLILIGFAARDIAFALGPYGLLIGYGPIIAYWTYFNSDQAGGQTPGKRWLNLSVVNQEQKAISLQTSFYRSMLLWSIFLAEGVMTHISQVPVISQLVTTIVLGGGLALFYGILINRSTRQGIHDLLFETYVVQGKTTRGIHLADTPMIHRRVTYGMLLVGLVASIGISFFSPVERLGETLILEEGEWAELEEVQGLLEADLNVFSISVQRRNVSTISSGTTQKILNIEVWSGTSCQRRTSDCSAIVNQIAKTTLDHYDGIESLTGMRIAIVNRFDFGIANGNNTQVTSRSIKDWRAALEEID